MSAFPRSLLVAAGAAGAVVVALLVLAALDAREIAHGDLLPWDIHGVRQIDALGLRVYLDAETNPDTNVVNGWVIVAIAAVCGFAALIGHRIGVPRRHVRFLALISAATLWLALDEDLGLHESIGYNLPFLADLPGVSHPDDALIGLYLLGGLLVLYLHRDLLRASRAAMRWFAGTLLLGVGAVGADLSGVVPYHAEEYVEILTSLTILVAMSLLAAELVGVPRAARGSGSRRARDD
jgi:hypothetical protein